MASPSTIRGFHGRWRASTITGLVDGDPVASWPADGVGNALTQATASRRPIYKTGGPNGRPYVLSDGVDDIMTTPWSLTTSEHTLYVVLRRAGSFNNTRIVSVANSAVITDYDVVSRWTLVYSSSTQVAFYRSNLASTNTSYNDNTNFHSLTTKWDSNGGILYYDGALASSTLGTSGTFNSDRMGIAGQAGSVPSDYGISGFVEIISYNVSHTAAERAEVHSYIQNEYAVAVSDYVADTTGPRTLTGLALWLDAGDISGVNADPVTNWYDNSGLAGRTFTQAAALEKPTLRTAQLNGKPVVRFDGTNDSLVGPLQSVLYSGNISLFVVAKNWTAGTPVGGASGQDILIRDFGGTIFPNTGGASFSATPVASGATTVLNLDFDYTADNYFVRQNGAQTGSGIPVIATASGNITLGRWLTNASDYFAGDIAEVIAYNRRLSPAERATIHSYIQDKYAISVSDYLQTSSPSVISGLSGWWDASSINPGEAGAVATLPDRSGLGRTVEQVDSTKRPTWRGNAVNGKPVLRFDGTNDFLRSLSAANPALVGADGSFTAFAVVSRTAANTGGFSIADQDNDAAPNRTAQFLRTFNNNLESIAFNNTGSAFVDAGPSMGVANQSYIVSSTRTTTSVESFVNGVSNGSTAVTGTGNTTSAIFSIGAYNGGTLSHWPGDIAEVIIYNRNLTASERATVHSYLQDRYAVTVSDYVGATKVRNLRLGGAELSKIFIGSGPVTKAYLGTTLVFEA